MHIIHQELHAVEQQIRRHAYLQALEEGQIVPARLRCFVGEQCHIIPGDLRSIALLVSRCEHPGSQQFFRDVLQGEAAALEALEPLATAVAMSPADRAAYEPAPGAQAYSAYLAWLCLYGTDAEAATALSVNFAAWGPIVAAWSRLCASATGYRRQLYGFSRSSRLHHLT